MSTGPTAHKFRLCPRLRFCCLHLLRRPCRLFFRWSSFRLGPTVAEPPLLVTSGHRGKWFRSIGSTPPTAPRPAPTARKPRPPRSASPSQSSIDPVTTVPIQYAINSATPAPPLLGSLPPETPRRIITPAALAEMPSPAEIEFIESVERYSHTDWVREQRANAVCNFAIRCLLLGSPSVLPDELLLHLAPHKRPSLSNVRSLADKGRLYTDDDGTLVLVRKLTPPAPVCPEKPAS